jgi:hypothetical protein
VATLEASSFVCSFVRSFVDERENKKSGLYAVGDFDRERRFFGEPSKPASLRIFTYGVLFTFRTGDLILVLKI